MPTPLPLHVQHVAGAAAAKAVAAWSCETAAAKHASMLAPMFDETAAMSVVGASAANGDGAAADACATIAPTTPAGVRFAEARAFSTSTRPSLVNGMSGGTQCHNLPAKLNNS